RSDRGWGERRGSGNCTWRAGSEETGQASKRPEGSHVQMKISKVTPWIVETGREYVFVQVETDEGVTGWGEVTGTGKLPNRAVAAVMREMSAFLEGQDASRIEAIWNRVFRAMTYVGTRGVTTCALSGIDIALWDIAGKAAGKPVYELL